jgi:Glycosyl hydrolase catalytic core
LKICSLGIVGVVSLSVLAIAAADEPRVPNKRDALPLKSGIGLPERQGYGVKHLEDLRVAWYYNWGPKTDLKTKAQFVPMAFGKRAMAAPFVGEIVLGFNEPDHPRQANLTVKEALEAWPLVMRQAKLVGSPAVAGNPVTGDWLPMFIEGNPKVDFITAHWYKGVNADKFIKDMKAIHDKYKKPIWVTEFAPQTMADAATNPTKFTQEEVNRFIVQTTRWMEETSFVERYAWHDSRAGTSALFVENGKLTETGKAYSAASRVK